MKTTHSIITLILGLSILGCNNTKVNKLPKDPYITFKPCQLFAENEKIGGRLILSSISRKAKLENIGYYFGDIDAYFEKDAKGKPSFYFGHSIFNSSYDTGTKLQIRKNHLEKLEKITTFQWLGHESQIDILNKTIPDKKIQASSNFYMLGAVMPHDGIKGANRAIPGFGLHDTGETKEKTLLKELILNRLYPTFKDGRINQIKFLYLMDEPSMYSENFGINLEDLIRFIDYEAKFIRTQLAEEIAKKYFNEEKKSIDPKQIPIPKTVVVYSTTDLDASRKITVEPDLVGFDTYAHSDFTFNGNIIDVRSPAIDDFLCSTLLKMQLHQNLFIVPQAFVGRAFPATEELAFSKLLNKGKDKFRLEPENHQKISKALKKTLNLSDSQVKKLLPDNLNAANGNFEEFLFMSPGLTFGNKGTREGNLLRRLRRYMCLTDPETQLYNCDESGRYKDTSDFNKFPNGLGNYTRNKYNIDYPIALVMPFIWNWPDKANDYTIKEMKDLDPNPLSTVGDSGHFESIALFADGLAKWGEKIKWRKPAASINLPDIDGDEIGNAFDVSPMFKR